MSSPTSSFKKIRTSEKKLRRRERKTQSVDIPSHYVSEIQKSDISLEPELFKEKPKKTKKKHSDNDSGSECESPRYKRRELRKFESYDNYFEEDADVALLVDEPSLLFEDATMKAKLKRVIERYQRAKKDITYFESNRIYLEKEMEDAKDTLQIMDSRVKEAEERYYALNKEYKAMKELLGVVEKDALKLVQETAALDTKLQHLQRQANRGLFKQLLAFLIMLIIYIIVSPVLLGTFIYDVIVNKKIQEENSKAQTFKIVYRWAKKQNKNFEQFLDNLEDLIMNRKEERPL